MSKRKPAKGAIGEDLIQTVCRRLAENKRVRRTLPDRGRLHVDRQLPFLCVYRRPPDRDDTGTEQLVKGEASYLVASGGAQLAVSVSTLVGQLAETLGRQFGAFLVLELWAAPDGGKAHDPANLDVLPSFQVLAPHSSGLSRTIETLEQELEKIKILKQAVAVEVIRSGSAHPPQLRPLLSAGEAKRLNCSIIGLAVPPVYRNPQKEQQFPLLLRSLHHSLGLALRRTFYQFARSQTTHRPPHYHALGRRAVVKAVWEVDRQLAEVSNAFDYLLQLTPVNSDDAWREFRRQRYQRAPEFHYRPLPIDPGLTKRKLFNIPIDRVEDVALHQLFLEKQDELERKITMLQDRDTPRFLYGSLQLFGNVGDDLLKQATELLERLPPRTNEESAGRQLGAEAFAEQARQEIQDYHQQCPEFTAKARVTREVSGLLVSRGSLLIGKTLKVSASRVEALLQHEVGTHLLTYFNGRAQPFKQLYSGLAGYEELQEGLAVLAEYLVGGLSRLRMRQLAARVVAAHQVIDGAAFVDAFRTLQQRYRFAAQTAFLITMRVFRGGGLTKDAVYLRGLSQILQYVQQGGELNPLFVGKIAVEQIPIIEELQIRRVLVPPPIQPKYMTNGGAAQRLAHLRRSNGSLLDLVAGL